MADKKDMNQALSLHQKYGLMGFYIRRALKHVNELTESQIEQSPYFVKYVLPNLKTDLEKQAAWFGIVQDELKSQILNIKEPDGFCYHCDKEMFKDDEEFLDNESVCCSQECVEARQAQR